MNTLEKFANGRLLEFGSDTEVSGSEGGVAVHPTRNPRISRENVCLTVNMSHLIDKKMK
ncbi:Uncharacterised protein [Vibrio cholerae]|uniref:Uncharacterized protein n=1 Tax=Vibrio cholerae TaxID=666 RepID=A0A655XXT5_VIBCL|nr:Uncharacterised protein [Vibrio cholerae]CSA84115.1 Uncharacterised protein [Vibrio cholerae]CSB94447.1 Uncharacterised protein [Vibrio cholerae]CSB99601.1 Uncharacterised protein [Vibrio cholerae]CSC24172.1 Uncharacterised protein [Vibrio cholerae]